MKGQRLWDFFTECAVITQDGQSYEVADFMRQQSFSEVAPKEGKSLKVYRLIIAIFETSSLLCVGKVPGPA